MVNDQPAMPRKYRRSTRSDFQAFPGRDRSGDPAMGIKKAEVPRFEAIRRQRAIGDPDAFAIHIHKARLALAGSFLGTCAVEERPMEHGQLHFSGVVGTGNWEEAGVLVIHMDEI